MWRIVSNRYPQRPQPGWKMPKSKIGDDLLDNPELPKPLAPAGSKQLAMKDLAPDMAKLASNSRVVFCGDIDMRIDATGKWYFKGSLITRPSMIRLFATILRCDDHGQFWLTTPVEMTRITVDDAPFMAVELITSVENETPVITFRTNVDTLVRLDDDHALRIAADPANHGIKPYIVVRDRLEALLERSVVYHLVDLAEQSEINGETVLGIWSCGRFFPIGAIET